MQAISANVFALSAIRRREVPHMSHVIRLRMFGEAADDHIDIERIEFDAAADPAGLLGGDEG